MLARSRRRTCGNDWGRILNEIIRGMAGKGRKQTWIRCGKNGMSTEDEIWICDGSTGHAEEIEFRSVRHV